MDMLPAIIAAVDVLARCKGLSCSRACGLTMSSVSEWSLVEFCTRCPEMHVRRKSNVIGLELAFCHISQSEGDFRTWSSF
jgi:hypothetical protein